MTFWLPPEWWGLLAAVVYGTVGYFVGDRYPFSGYGLYAGAASRTHGSMPVFFADGEEAPLHLWVGFEGIAPEQVHYDGIPCAHQWLVMEARAWITRHQASEPSADSVPVVWGYRHYRVTDDGKVEHEFEGMVTGRARRR